MINLRYVDTRITSYMTGSFYAFMKEERRFVLGDKNKSLSTMFGDE